MILKNAWGKYDRDWVVGDIRLTRNPDFHISGGSAKRNFRYDGIEGTNEYVEKDFIFNDRDGWGDFCKVVFYMLDKHIKKGTEAITCLEFAVQYCMRMGMFDEQYRQSQQRAFIKDIKAMTEEKDGFRYHEMLHIIGGSTDNISAYGMAFIERKTNEKLVYDHISPKHTFPGDKTRATREFYNNLRYAITSHPLNKIFILEELSTPICFFR